MKRAKDNGKHMVYNIRGVQREGSDHSHIPSPHCHFPVPSIVSAATLLSMDLPRGPYTAPFGYYPHLQPGDKIRLGDESSGFWKARRMAREDLAYDAEAEFGISEDISWAHAQVSLQGSKLEIVAASAVYSEENIDRAEKIIETERERG